MKRYPAPLNIAQEGFVSRFKLINKWSQKIQEYELQDQEDHAKIVQEVQQFL